MRKGGASAAGGELCLPPPPLPASPRPSMTARSRQVDCRRSPLPCRWAACRRRVELLCAGTSLCHLKRSHPWTVCTGRAPLWEPPPPPSRPALAHSLSVPPQNTRGLQLVRSKGLTLVGAARQEVRAAAACGQMGDTFSKSQEGSKGGEKPMIESRKQNESKEAVGACGRHDSGAVSRRLCGGGRSRGRGGGVQGCK